MKRALVLGGGVAGLAGAFGLRELGYRVELFEAHGWLGGRVFSPPAHGFAARPDNGPHVMLGCYDRMRALLRRLGTEDGFEAPRALRLCYADARGARVELTLAAHVPAPLALPWALARLTALRWRARLQALRGMLAAVRGAPPSWSLGDWLDRRGQRGAPAAWLWEPLCRAIMNGPPEAVAADLFLRTVRRAFGGSAAAAAIWLPKRPWAELVGEPALTALRAAGVGVHLHRRVAAVEGKGGAVQRVAFRDGEAVELGAGDLVLSALPQRDLARVTPGVVMPSVGAPIPMSPIVSIYFELDDARGLPHEPLVVLVDGVPFHFYCRRPDDPPGTFALLAGGNRDLDGVGTAEIEAHARAQLARHFPAAVLPAAGRARVVKEAHATILAEPGLDARRPAPGPLAPWHNLHVCGDWTATGLPSTLEGAAESAQRAISLIARRD